jgi:hypothetical protein
MPREKSGRWDGYKMTYAEQTAATGQRDDQHRVAKETAREILRNGDDPLRHVQAFESLWVRSKYAKEIQTLGTLHDDVWVAQSTGRSDEHTRDWVTSVLKDFAR